MNRSPTAPESPELIRLRQQVQQTEIKDRQALLKEFLGNVKEMIRDQATLHLPKTVDETQRSTILQPQVFLSYAWEAASTPKLTHLHTFLKQLATDLAAAGLTPWLDIQRMTGDLDEQMHSGIQDSQYVLLIGTNRYAERTKPDSDTNVRKELDFTLKEAKKSVNFLLPLMLEGDYGTTFPTVLKFLIRDGRSWYSLEQGQWQSQENYIKELTQSEPLGILPCLLGLNRRERPWLKYRQACVKQYGQLQQSLMNALALLQRHQGDTDSKRSPSRPSIQLTPVLQIPFRELEYDKKADKIGSGSYGEVYRGWWQGKYSVAVKELTGTLTTEAEKDLYREAGIMAHMAKVSTEPYPTVQLFGLAVEKPNFALVMEYVPNGTLFDLLQLYSEIKLPWDLRYQLAADIADGVALLHRQHILHRDLRSHNILLNMMDGRLRAKLSDFGLSTVKSSVRTHSTVAKKTESVGTRAWMAPELHKRGGQSSSASDIYSYGMVLWELLTHATPFADAQGDTSLISDWVTKGETETIPGDCPPPLAELIKKCWALKPEDRIRMDGIQKELAALVKSHPLSSETQAIIETLKKSQQEREIKWSARWQGKRRDTEKETETGHELEIKKQAEIARLKQQHQAEQSALQKQMEQLKLDQEKQQQALEIQKRAAAEEKQRLEAEKQTEIERLKQQHQAELKRSQEKTELKPLSQTISPPKPTPAMSQVIPQILMPAPKPLLKPADAKTLEQLLRWVAEGEQDKVEALIQKDRNLLLHAGVVNDLSGREFKGITAFQYALWALDWHMWTMIQKYLPKESQAEQLQALESKGTAHGKHFSLQELTDALQVYVDNAQKAWKYDKRATDHWCKVVGGAQTRLPVHVVNEYCREDRSFDPCPAFTEEKLPRIRTSQYFYDKGDWFTTRYAGGLCGGSFAFARTPSRHAGDAPVTTAFPLSVEGVPLTDLKALQSLWKTRTQQLELLRSQLLSVTNQSQVLGS